MTTVAPSAERSMFGGQIVRDRALMDEPTLDCHVCTRPGSWEVQDQILTDDLAWMTYYRLVLCADHLRTAWRPPDIAPEHYRMVLMPL